MKSNKTMTLLWHGGDLTPSRHHVAKQRQWNTSNDREEKWEEKGGVTRQRQCVERARGLPEMAPGRLSLIWLRWGCRWWPPDQQATVGFVVGGEWWRRCRWTVAMRQREKSCEWGRETAWTRTMWRGTTSNGGKRLTFAGNRLTSGG